MDQIIAKIFSEQGIISALFVISFIGFIMKGIPFLINKIFSQQDLQHQMYKMELQNITDVFKDSVKTISDNSTAWHSQHSKDLQDIKIILNKKYQGKDDMN
jgi:hypothetical protein